MYLATELTGVEVPLVEAQASGEQDGHYHEQNEKDEPDAHAAGPAPMTVAPRALGAIGLRRRPLTRPLLVLAT